MSLRKAQLTRRTGAEDVLEKLIDTLTASAIGSLLQLDQEDSIWEDLGGSAGYDYSDGHSSPVQDFAACDKECGYCGHCHYRAAYW